MPHTWLTSTFHCVYSSKTILLCVFIPLHYCYLVYIVPLLEPLDITHTMHLADADWLPLLTMYITVFSVVHSIPTVPDQSATWPCYSCSTYIVLLRYIHLHSLLIPLPCILYITRYWCHFCDCPYTVWRSDCYMTLFIRYLFYSDEVIRILPCIPVCLFTIWWRYTFERWWFYGITTDILTLFIDHSLFLLLFIVV